MRILMLLENDFVDDIRVKREVHSLNKIGYKVIIAAVTRSGDSNKVLLDDCTLYRRRINSFTHKTSVGALRFPFYFNFWRNYVNEILSEERVDIVHVHDLPLSKIGIEIKEKKGKKLILDMHENYPALLEISKHTQSLAGKLLSPIKPWRKYETESLQKADAVIAVVEEMKERLVKTGIDPEKITIVENTSQLKTADRAPREKSDNTLRLTYIGGITLHRGLHFIIKGLILLKSEIPCLLTIAGDGSYRKELEKMCELSGLQNSVVFLGKISRKETEKILAESDIALIPHLRSEQADNSSPNKLFEYMGNGIPVLASDCTSVKRIITETCCGITYLNNSPEDIADKIKYLYNNRQELPMFSKNGLDSAREKYNWDITEKNLLALYSSLNVPGN